MTDRQPLTARQQFIRSVSRREAHLYCARCGEPPRFAGGLCSACDTAPKRDARMPHAAALRAPRRT